VKYLAQSFGEMVERRLKALNTNAFSVEKAHGLPLDAIRNVTRSEKRSGPTLVRAEEICDALGLEFYIGPPRIPPGGFADADTETDFARPDAARGGYHAIPWHRPGLGTPSSPIALRQEWMSRRAANDIWCYEEKGKMVIARVAFDRGAIIITRENPPQPPRLLLESDRSLVTLQGRVVWLGSLT
jgi:hypothetical protein